MAHLLGSKYCIESLRDDVTDLHTTVVEVFSRAGPVNHPSWKYPDKMSSDINVSELLDIYCYDEDEEEDCQVAHIVLLELVIDRLVLLLQAMTKYLENALSSGRVTSASGPANNTSVGLVIKKYWNKLVHVHTVIQQLQSEARTKNRKIADLENTILKMTEELEEYQTQATESGGTLCASTATTPFNPDALLPGGLDSSSFASLVAMANKKKDISQDEYTKASQTIETAFVPCEGCDRVQESLRELGRELVSVCTAQGLPSSLERHMEGVAELDWLTHHDVSRWVCEQKKDLVRINKHLEYLMSTINPLKENLCGEQAKSQALRENLSTLEKELSLERETQTIQLAQYERKLKEAEHKTTETVDKIQKCLDDMTSRRNDLETELAKLQEELSMQRKAFTDLEKEKAATEEELRESQTNNAEVQRLEADLIEVQAELESSRQKLSEVSKELAKEKVKTRSASRHTESLQGKQGSLLQRIDALDLENEELRVQLSELEEEKERMETNLERANDRTSEYSTQLAETKTTIKDLNEEKAKLEHFRNNLEEKMLKLEDDLQKAREQQRLLVEYPDLNGPVNKDLVGTGDVAVDMENQVKANCLRIHVLEEQNASLRNTITKMLQAQAKAAANTSEDDPAPVTLWRPKDAFINTDVDSNDHGSADLTYKPQGARDHGNHGLPPRPPPVTKAKSAPSHQRAPPDQADDNSEQLFYHRSRPDLTATDKLFHRRTPSEKSPTQKGSDKNIQGGREWVPQETFVVRKAPKPKGGVKTRPISAKAAMESGKPAQASASSISAYIQLKKSGLLKMSPGGKSRPASAATKEPSGGGLAELTGADAVSCDKCDKMYASKKDLEIHRLYCFGGI